MRTLAELSHAMDARLISSQEVVELALAAAQRWQSRINAFRATYAQTASEAARLRDRQADKGANGPLYGIPLAYKDMFDWPGHRSSYGSRIPQAKAPEVAATALARLEAAGAVTVGFLSMSEFALGPTGHNAPFGHCRNAVDPLRIAGGSSAGSAAAVSAGIVPASLGSDTGGSIRIPASVNGVTGLKPTQGRISRAGAMLLASSLDCVGPIGRSAEDCGLILAVVSGADPRDATALGPAYRHQALQGRKRLRLGFPKDFGAEQTDADVLAAVVDAVRTLEREGASVVDVDLPEIGLLHRLADAIQKPESAAVHRGRLTGQAAAYTPHIRRRIEAGYFVPAVDYIDALAQRELWLRRFVDGALGDVDALIVPTVGIAVPTIEETDEEARGAMPDLVGRMTRWTRWLNYLGVPALTVPCGRDRNGMPVGMQIVGRPFAEAQLIQIGMLFQSLTEWHLQVPDLFSEPPQVARPANTQDRIQA
ncbi:Asp-tRNA(Asn)/Glu-tRNA(Gln) amidotransferase GatCAB subunit A [Mesorhizobium loti]|nr:amidase [Mesorhizobium loti]PLP56657.1 Asp-tRNA(Asn)/Glu-tRNA(Gln) amidotransferase GatCAB subunit A [Mesorhizobium loti]